MHIPGARADAAADLLHGPAPIPPERLHGLAKVGVLARAGRDVGETARGGQTHGHDGTVKERPKALAKVEGKGVETQRCPGEQILAELGKHLARAEVFVAQEELQFLKEQTPAGHVPLLFDPHEDGRQGYSGVLPHFGRAAKGMTTNLEYKLKTQTQNRNQS